MTCVFKQLIHGSLTPYAGLRQSMLRPTAANHGYEEGKDSI